jgi:hypothetical protein
MINIRVLWLVLIVFILLIVGVGVRAAYNNIHLNGYLQARLDQRTAGSDSRIVKFNPWDEHSYRYHIYSAPLPGEEGYGENNFEYDHSYGI